MSKGKKVLGCNPTCDNDRKPPVSVLVDESLKKLHDRGDYSPRGIKYTKETWNQFLTYCSSNGYDAYLPECVEGFVSSIESHVPPLKTETIMRKKASMKILGFYARNETWKKGALNPKPELLGEFAEFVSSQDDYLKKHHYSEVSRATIHKQTYAFLLFFQSRGLQKLSDINHDCISAYILTLKGHARSTLRGELSRIRMILKNAYLLEYVKEDRSVHVPHYSHGQPQSNVKIWKSDEINNVLETVDRSSPRGLRDAAFITIAADLGMRSKDICDLKLGDIDWEACSIAFQQSKTGRANVLPLSERTGNAIIDYLHVRPETDCEYLFVNFAPPYDKMRSFNSKFLRYVQRSGVTVPKEAHHGLHSLRATLATRLLECNVLPDDIAALLGHADRESLHSYIRMDIEHLRECALSFEDGEFI